jgi:hypothetical protein
MSGWAQSAGSRPEHDADARGEAVVVVVAALAGAGGGGTAAAAATMARGRMVSSDDGRDPVPPLPKP